jgi:antitoxin component YwqK of YwqJK toxin-antitoxin module
MEWLKHFSIDHDGHGNVINGSWQGTRYSYYSSGQLEYEWNYANGHIVGIQRSWYRNGQIRYEDNYDHSIHLDWYSNGQLLRKRKYVNGGVKN